MANNANIDPDYLAHICGEIEYHLAGMRAKVISNMQAADRIQRAVSDMRDALARPLSLPQAQTGIRPFDKQSPEAELAVKVRRMHHTPPPDDHANTPEFYR